MLGFAERYPLRYITKKGEIQCLLQGVMRECHKILVKKKREWKIIEKKKEKKREKEEKGIKKKERKVLVKIAKIYLKTFTSGYQQQSSNQS